MRIESRTMTREEQIEAAAIEASKKVVHGDGKMLCPSCFKVGAYWADENNIHGYMAELTEKAEDLDDLNARLAIAVEALEFYGNGEHVYSPSNEPGIRPGKIGYDDPDEIRDYGEAANEALKRIRAE